MPKRCDTNRRLQVLVFGVVLVVGSLVPVRSFAATDYTEKWTATKWRVAYLHHNDDTGAYEVARQSYNSYGGYNRTMTPANRQAATSDAYCLGTSEWQVDTTVGNQTTTERWLGDIWQDTYTSNLNFFYGGYSVEYGQLTDCSHPSGVYFAPTFNYEVSVECWGYQPGNYAGCYPNQSDPLYVKYYLKLYYSGSPTAVAVSTTGLYGGLIHKFDTLSGWRNKHANIWYDGSVRSFPTVWRVSGTANPSRVIIP